MLSVRSSRFWGNRGLFSCLNFYLLAITRGFQQSTAPNYRISQVQAMGMGESKPEEGYCQPEPSVSFFLLRHGQTNFNVEGRIQGTLDASVLTEEGKQQAHEVGKFLATEKPFDKIFVSPMTRARQTLEIVVEELTAAGKPIPPIETVNEIREIELFEWQGKLKSDLVLEYPAEVEAWLTNPVEFVLSGRQPVVELFERAQVGWRKVLASLVKSPEITDKSQPRILLVAHGAINQALIGAAFGYGVDLYRKYPFANCGMGEIIWNVNTSNEADMFRWYYPELGQYIKNEELGQLPVTDKLVH